MTSSTPLIGASVLPITIDPVLCRGYVWLGQEHYRLWSDFGGRFDAGTDECAEDTAAREMAEETRDVFGDVHYWKRRLKDARDFLWKVRVRWDDGREFVCFVVRMPWNPENISLFSDRASKTCEKTRIGLFSVQYVWDSGKTVMALRNHESRQGHIRPFLHIRSVCAQTLLAVLERLMTERPSAFSVAKNLGELDDELDDDLDDDLGTQSWTSLLVL